MAGIPQGLQQFLQCLAALHGVVLRSIDFRFAAKTLQHGGEFEIEEELDGAFVIRLLQAPALRIELHRRLQIQGDQFLRNPGLVEIFAQAFLNRLARQVIEIIVNRIQTAVSREQFLGRLGADFGHAGDVIAGIAHQRQVIDDILRRHTHFFCHAFRVEDFDFITAPAQVVDFDVRRNDLHQVFVAGDQEGIDAPRFGLLCQGGQNIIRFVAGDFQDRDIQGFNDLAQCR